MNTELFKKINDVVSVDPYGRLDMSIWEDETCGTTRCVAGWAISLTTGQPLTITGPGGVRQHPSVLELAARLGVAVTTDGHGRSWASFESLAAKLLHLASADRDLFYSSGDTALEFVALAATGADGEARATLGY